jgi:S1-C subfamily serine protease
VPRSVATCRCGAGLPADAAPISPDAAEPSSGGSTTLIAIVVGVLAIGGAGYWYFTGAAPAAGRAAAAAAEDVAPESTGAAAATAASPEARAWDARAKAGEPHRDSMTPVTAAVPAAPAAPGALSASIEEMVDRVMPAVVLIETTSGRGSGFFVRHDTLITNVHVVQNDGYVTLRRMDGSTVNARVELRAPALDIAVLKVATPSAAQAVIPMGSANSLRAGQEIIVIGSALGTLQNSVSRGIVSGLRSSGGATLVQTDAATNPGNSGGPMLDRNGAAIGITTMSYKNAEGLNFGVAIDHARDLLEGRQANLGSQRGLTDIQSQSRGSESDRRQRDGEEQLRQQVGELAQAASRIDSGWKRFRDQCYTSAIGGRYDREWFALLVPRGIASDAGAGCVSYFAEMDSDVKQFRGLMQRVLSDARRANILPGTIRDLLRTNRLDFEWER